MIRKEVVLSCGVDEAFQLFTERATDWWPKERRHTDDASSQIRMLPSGRFWERAADGREVELGSVRIWEPPVRLVIDFYVGTGPAQPTELVVAFNTEGDRTRVVIEHRPTPESQDLWDQRAPRFEESWTLLLTSLERAASLANW